MVVVLAASNGLSSGSSGSIGRAEVRVLVSGTQLLIVDNSSSVSSK